MLPVEGLFWDAREVRLGGLLVPEDIFHILPGTLVNVLIAGLEGSPEDGEVGQDNSAYMVHA
ncbi:MAG: hypothetical protein K0Q90_1912, partial [Paenibacillaceae bacterium]|nr:hypothetical protein [Paenibacillaceae bacterium]